MTRHDQTKEKILKTARDLVLESGPDKLSLRKVAAAASFSPSSIYEYFESKEEIIQTLAASTVSKLDALMAKVPKSIDAPSRLARFMACYITFARKQPEDFLLAFHRLPSGRTSPAQAVEDTPYGRILKTARDGIEDGSFLPQDAETIAYGAWGLAHGLATLQVTHLKNYDVNFKTADKVIITAWISGLGRKKNS